MIQKSSQHIAETQADEANVRSVPQSIREHRRESASAVVPRPTVCHVIHALGVGGAEVLVDTMVRRMTDRYRCVVAVLDEVGEIGERLRQDGFVVEYLHRRPGIDHGCARRLQKLAAREQVQILHAHQYTPFFQAMLSRGLFGRLPVVFTEHGRHVPDLPDRKRSVVNRLLLRKRDRLIGVGGAVRKALIANEGLPADRVEVIYNGVDLSQFAKPADDAWIRVRREFGFSENDFVIIQVARLHTLKDHQTALRTLNELRRFVPRARLLIVGDGDERRCIENTIEELSLTDHVRVAGSRSDVSSLLAASDVFLLTSISEGIPLTIIEAMAAGLPVVSTAVGGIPEMIDDGRTGFLAEAGDHSSLAASLGHLYQSPMLRQIIARAGRDTAQRQFSLQGMLNGYTQLYQEVIDAC